MRSIAAADHLASQVTRPSVRSALRSMLPTGVFLAFDGWLGLAAGMIAASVTTLGLLVLRRRRDGGVGLLLPLSLGFVVVKAIAGVITESPVVYFGAGVTLSALVAVAIGVTAFTGRPAASYAIPLVTPYRHLSPNHPVYRRVSSQVTAVVALAELGLTTWEAWHLTVSTASAFLATRTLMAWPVMGVVIFFAIFYVRFRLDRYEHSLARGVGIPVGPTAHWSFDADVGSPPNAEHTTELEGSTP